MADDVVSPDADPPDGAEGVPEADGGVTSASAPRSHLRVAVIAGLVAVVALAALTGWLGYRYAESKRLEQQRAQYLEVGRQGAVNLTTVDFEHADADVQRILDSATGTFYDDFSKRAQPYVEVVKQAKSTSVGTVQEAGLLSVAGDEAQVLVAVTVKTSNAGVPEQVPRAWRMRISVERTGGDVKVSNVEFVS